MRAFHQKWPLVEKSFSDCPVVPYGSAGLEKWPCICEETQLSTIDLSFFYDSVSGIHAYWCFSRSASPPPLFNWLRLVIWIPFCSPIFSLARFISGRNVTIYSLPGRSLKHMLLPLSKCWRMKQVINSSLHDWKPYLSMQTRLTIKNEELCISYGHVKPLMSNCFQSCCRIWSIQSVQSSFACLCVVFPCLSCDPY